MDNKSCSVCSKPARFHTAGNNPSFFCGQECASWTDTSCQMSTKSLHHDVIDSEHPLHGFVTHNPWLAECIGEMTADGSIKVTNKSAVQPLINHLIGLKRGADSQEDNLRDPSAFGKDDTEASSSLFDMLANMNLKDIKKEEDVKSAPKRSTAEEEEEKRKRTDQGLQTTYEYIWEVPIEVVSEILLALVDYDMQKMSPDLTRAMYDFAQNRSKFLEYLYKLQEPTRKKMAFAIIQRVPGPEVQAMAYLREKRELVVLGALLQLDRVHRGSSTSFWNMQEDESLNTLMHYAVANNYNNLARAMYIRGASSDIKNRNGVSAKDLIKSFNRDPNLFSFP